MVWVWTLKNLVFLRKTLNVLFKYLDAHMLSVPITTKVVTLNTAHGGVYSIQHYVIKFISDLRQVSGFFWVLQFSPPLKLTAMIYLKYCWK
jgi:hypothetical protein